MRKYYFSINLLLLMSLFLVSCNQEKDETIVESDKVAVEPDFFEKDGSVGEAVQEEEAPTTDATINAKSYG